MKLNKNETTRRIINIGKAMACQKLEMQNLVFPKWDELGLIGMMFRQCVSTKEQPLGNIYDETTYQVVLRVLDGRVLMAGRPDCYCWKHSKVDNAKNITVIGTHSADGLLVLSSILESVTDESEKKMLADMFVSLGKDLLMVTTPAENRWCIEISQEMYDSGITACVDEWMEEDESGMAEATQLSVGDYVIVTGNNNLYRVGHDEFLETHRIL